MEHGWEETFLIYEADVAQLSTRYISVPRRQLVKLVLAEAVRSVEQQCRGVDDPAVARAVAHELRLVPGLQHRDVRTLERGDELADDTLLHPQVIVRRACFIVAIGPIRAAVFSTRALMFVQAGTDDDIMPLITRVSEHFRRLGLARMREGIAPAAMASPPAASHGEASSPAKRSATAAEISEASGGGEEDEEGGSVGIASSSGSGMPWELFCLEALLASAMGHLSRQVQRAEGPARSTVQRATDVERESLGRWEGAIRCLLPCLRRREQATWEGRGTAAGAAADGRGQREGARGSAGGEGGGGLLRRLLAWRPAGGVGGWRGAPHSRTASHALLSAAHITQLGGSASRCKALRAQLQAVEHCLSSLLDEEQDLSNLLFPASRARLTHHGDTAPVAAAGAGEDPSCAPDRSAPVEAAAAAGAAAAGVADEPTALVHAYGASAWPASPLAPMPLQAPQQPPQLRQLPAHPHPNAPRVGVPAHPQTAKAAAGSVSAAQAGAAESASQQLAEVVLEGYLTQTDGLLRRTRGLLQDIEAAETQSRLLMNVSQNHIWVVQVLLTAVSAFLSACLTITAVLGMNLGNKTREGLYDEHSNWLLVVCITGGVAVLGSIAAATTILYFLDIGSVGAVKGGDRDAPMPGQHVR
jgi:hypothetical protein